MMESSLETLFDNRVNKGQIISKIKTNSAEFEEAIRIALTNQQPQGWRAAWLLGHCIRKDDARIHPYVNQLISGIKGKGDGHQRELLKILEKMNVEEDLEGRLFDECMTIWESLGKSSSVRVVAFRLLISIAQKYPDLINEIEILTSDHYTETLTPGVKKSFSRILGGFRPVPNAHEQEQNP